MAGLRGTGCVLHVCTAGLSKTEALEAVSMLDDFGMPTMSLAAPAHSTVHPSMAG